LNTLYTGVGGQISHLAEQALYDFGQASTAMTWMTQSDLKIRPDRFIGAGTTANSLWWVDYSDPTPANWIFRKQSDPTSGHAGWLADAAANIQTLLDNYETAYGAQSGSPAIKVMFDNESIIARAGAYGRVMQTAPRSHPFFTTQAQIDKYTTLASDALIAFIQEAQSNHANTEFGWYSLFLPSRYAKSLRDIPPVGPEEFWYDNAKDSQWETLLTESDWIDLHSYWSPVLGTDLGEQYDYHFRNLSRQLASIAAASGDSLSGKPQVATFWAHNDSSDDGIHPSTHFRVFFQVCRDLGITGAAVFGDWNVWKSAAAEAGQDPGEFWVSRVEAAALEIGYLTPASTPTVPVPTINSVTPSSGEQSSSPTILIEGSGLQDTDSVELSGTGITVGSPTVTPDGQSVTVGLTIAAGATISARDVSCLDVEATPIATLTGGFSVISSGAFPVPTVDSVIPVEAEVGQTLILQIVGTGFRAPMTVTIGSKPALSVSVVTSKLIKATFQLRLDESRGNFDVTVSDPDAQEGVLADGFQILDRVLRKPGAGARVNPLHLQALGRRV